MTLPEQDAKTIAESILDARLREIDLYRIAAAYRRQHKSDAISAFGRDCYCATCKAFDALEGK